MILSFDLSLASTGWACGDGTAANTEWGTQAFTQRNDKSPLCQKHLKFRDWLCDQLELQQPSQVVFEFPVCHGQRGNVAALVGLQILLETECAARNIPCNGIWPVTNKALFAGHGFAEKSAMQQRAGELFCYDAEQDKGGDGADALGLLWVWRFKRDVLDAKETEKVAAKKRKRAKAKKGE